MSADVKTLAAESWFGYGRWDAPFWFIGMEPGGDDSHASYDSWLALGGDELIDCRAHHLWKRDVQGVEDPKWTQWHAESPGRRTQPTWRRLIQLLFGFKNRHDATDLDAIFEYQKHRLGRIDPTDGETALVELGALHAPGLATPIDRTSYREQRIKLLAKRLLTKTPTMAVCYGYKFKHQFEDVVGGEFDDDCFRWRSATLCALVPGPTSFLRGRPTPWASATWWIQKGRHMRETVDGEPRPLI